ncbi:DUF4064 domain-containing protein [Oceanobacillus timonensis]|uniref:DUF4064 domain-containing protein n=1 Tax=Oceanobacillus timonensis TaxID=1926285 RepID=UPI0015C4336A|nr:DUF4064 domain-containing protein [Oceanobacillus timonensis]
MRSGEVNHNVSIILIIISILSYGLLAMNSYSVLGDLEPGGDSREYLEETLQEAGDELAGVTMEEQIEIFGNIVSFVAIVAIIYAILGIAAAIFLAKRKKVRLIGILLIVFGGISVILTLVLGLIGIVASLGYLIAGVVALRKQKKTQNVIT